MSTDPLQPRDDGAESPREPFGPPADGPNGAAGQPPGRARFHAVQYHPAIPQNTGNIARSCVAFGTHLHLIHPMKFEIDEHKVQRAGLDYWPLLDLTEHRDDDAFLAWLGDRRPWLISKHLDGAAGHASQRYDRIAVASGDVFLFGNENTGLPDRWHERWPDRRVHIPMPGPLHGRGNVRSLNVANTVAIVLARAAVAIDPG